MNNVDYDVSVVSLQREATILNGTNIGQLKNGNIVRDVVGTIYNYAFEVAPNIDNLTVYDNLYETITSPAISYPLNVPFGQGNLEFDAYINSANDELLYMSQNKKLWDKLAFTAIATDPQRYYGETWNIGAGTGNQVFIIDGVGFNVNVTNLKRNGKVQDTGSSGRVNSGLMHREIIGTYYNYTMELEQALENIEEYDRLYYALTAPVDSHILVIPYGQSTLTFTMYVTKVSDQLTFLNDDIRRWSGLEIEFTAMAKVR